MKRSDVLGIMAAVLAARTDWPNAGGEYGPVQFIDMAEALLREAERVGPEDGVVFVPSVPRRVFGPMVDPRHISEPNT